MTRTESKWFDYAITDASGRVFAELVDLKAEIYVGSDGDIDEVESIFTVQDDPKTKIRRRVYLDDKHQLYRDIVDYVIGEGSRLVDEEDQPDNHDLAEHGWTKATLGLK